MKTLKPVLREYYDPHGDGWNMYIEEYAVDESNGKFYKRTTVGGNGWYGSWREYEEVEKKDVISFVFEDFEPSERTINSFVDDLMKAPALEEAYLDPCNKFGYIKSMSIDIDD